MVMSSAVLFTLVAELANKHAISKGDLQKFIKFFEAQ